MYRNHIEFTTVKVISTSLRGRIIGLRRVVLVLLVNNASDHVGVPVALVFEQVVQGFLFMDDISKNCQICEGDWDVQFDVFNFFFVTGMWV